MGNFYLIFYYWFGAKKTPKILGLKCLTATVLCKNLIWTTFFTSVPWTVSRSSSWACFSWCPTSGPPRQGRTFWTPNRLRSKRWNSGNSCPSTAPAGTATAGWAHCQWSRALPARPLGSCIRPALKQESGVFRQHFLGSMQDDCREFLVVTGPSVNVKIKYLFIK